MLRTPLLAFAFIFCVASFSSLWFCRVMAYLALFHFVKQQYGFFALYRWRFRFSLSRKIFGDIEVIYLARLYPVAYWHFAVDRSFDWFVNGNFFRSTASWAYTWNSPVCWGCAATFSTGPLSAPGV